MKNRNLLANQKNSSLGDKMLHLFAEKGQLIMESLNEEENSLSKESSSRVQFSLFHSQGQEREKSTNKNDRIVFTQNFIQSSSSSSRQRMDSRQFSFNSQKRKTSICSISSKSSKWPRKNSFNSQLKRKFKHSKNVFNMLSH